MTPLLLVWPTGHKGIINAFTYVKKYVEGKGWESLQFNFHSFEIPEAFHFSFFVFELHSCGGWLRAFFDGKCKLLSKNTKGFNVLSIPLTSFGLNGY